MITENDKILLNRKGISEEKLNAQLACFVQGFPFLKLAGAASVEKGILVPAAEAEANYLAAWKAYTAEPAHKVVEAEKCQHEEHERKGDDLHGYQNLIAS